MNFPQWEEPSNMEKIYPIYIEGGKAIYYIEDGRYGDFHDIRYQLHVIACTGGAISLETDFDLHLELFNLEDGTASYVKVKYFSGSKIIIMKGDAYFFKAILRQIFDKCDNFIIDDEVNTYEKLVQHFIIFHCVLIQDTNRNVFRKVCNLVCDLDRKGLKKQCQK